MKKIVGIIAALALAGSVFADDPSVVPSLVAFSGKASIEYQVDLDKEAFGIKNAESAEFKVCFVPKDVKKSTSGDGLWGELVIKTGDAANEYKATNTDASAAFALPTVAVDTAKIHFSDDDFYAVMNIKAPGLSVGGGDIITATSSKKAFPGASVTLTDKAGFTLNFGLKDTVDFNIQFADNGVVKSDAKKFAFVFDASLKAVDGLTLNAGVGYGTEKEKLVAAVKADYKLAIGDMYLKPAVGFALAEDESKALNAGVLFGWGGDGIKPDFASFSNSVASVPNECADGVSVFATVPLTDSPAIGFLFSAFDSKFVGDFGLKVGAQLAVASLSNFGKGSDALDVAVKFSKAFGDWTVDANAGIKLIIEGSKFGALYGCGVSNSAIIDNTKLYINYAGEHGADVGGADLKGAIKIGAEISL